MHLACTCTYKWLCLLCDDIHVHTVLQVEAMLVRDWLWEDMPVELTCVWMYIHVHDIMLGMYDLHILFHTHYCQISKHGKAKERELISFPDGLCLR